VELDKWEKRCFRREIEALSSLRHPYLVEFIGATDVSPYWIVTAFMSGGALYYRLSERPPLSGTRKTIIAYDVAEGLAFLHSRGMIHRDLKSLNVLLDDAGEPCICDFGVTRMVDADRAMTGIMGTYHYMAPEVIRKAKCNIKADVFSFGMVLWEMVMPKVPFS
jgi:serine/threonine protein kinase